DLHPLHRHSARTSASTCASQHPCHRHTSTTAYLSVTPPSRKKGAVTALTPEALEGMILPFFRREVPGSEGATASMLRDLEAGAQTEADHILGFLLEAARRGGVPDELHEAAYLHTQAYEARRAAGRLPHP
ncbi:ketopantoate reductase C-terminal domain-containing protein, partial [Teichococcus vastitatis]